VPSGIGEDVQRLDRIVEPILQHSRAKGQRPVTLGDEVLLGRHAEVEVQLLRHRAFRPRDHQEALDVLKRNADSAGRVDEDEPIVARPIGLACRWRFVAGAVLVAEQLPVELGQPAGIGRVERDGAQRGKARSDRLIGHEDRREWADTTGAPIERPSAGAARLAIAAA
jgi:hypothetical protein